MRIPILLPTLILTAMLTACGPAPQSPDELDIQGHRGCRGLFPENSLPGFIHALELGVTTLEMDVAISADNQIVLSHEPYMSHVICKDSNGQPIAKGDARSFNIYQMTYEEIKQFDCGSRPHPRFPKQKKITLPKPLLSEVIAAAENYISQHGLPPVQYNIEIKTSEDGDGVFHPGPDEFAALLIEQVSQAGIAKRTIIQSFDKRALQSVKSINAGFTTALLVIGDPDYKAEVEALGFQPEIFSPGFNVVTEAMVSWMHQQGIKVIPWTANEVKDMKALMDLGVDGIITDYPDRLISLIMRQE